MGLVIKFFFTSVLILCTFATFAIVYTFPWETEREREYSSVSSDMLWSCSSTWPEFWTRICHLSDL